MKFSEAEQRLAGLAKQHPGLVKLEAIGKSAGGRALHVLTIAAAGAKDPSQRQAVFVGANMVGFHNAGTQAAIALAEKLVAQKDEAAVKKLLETRVFYIAPMLNPDAQDGYFAAVRYRQSLNVGKLDRDRDGLLGEDGPNDLNKDGRITMMRLEDPNGSWLADEKDPRVMRRADPLKGERGKYILLPEGLDDDGDGQFNEDPAGGYRPDKNFAHGWAENDPEAGPWPSGQPEAKAVMDFLLKRRNVALAVVFGPANNLLTMPRGMSGRGGDVGSMKVRVPRQFAAALGLDAEREYTIDEVYEVAKDSPMGRQPGFTKESLAQRLAGGAATSPDAEDLKFYQSLGEEYKKILEKAGLDTKRSGGQSAAGGLQNWLYYQYSVMAVELDVWGIPKKAGARPVGGGPNAGANGNAANGNGAMPDEDTLAYIDAGSKDAFVAWTPVTLPDGRKAEVGGVDPFLAVAPPAEALAQATQAHADAVIAMSAKLPEVAMGEVEVKALGSGIYRVKAVAVNQGYLPTATRLQVLTKSFLPARLEIVLPAGASLVQGSKRSSSERIAGTGGTHQAEWLVNGQAGMKISVRILTQNAGQDAKEVVLP